jgi:hypothetical protein
MKSLACRVAVAFASLALPLSLPRAAAQTVLELDGSGAVVFETDGPPAACGYPTGPVVGSFSYVAPFTCPTAAGVAGSRFLGDVGSHRFADTIWVTDGLTFTEYVGAGASFGTPIRSFVLPVGFVLPGPVTGMDVVASLGPLEFLVVTDGTLCAGIAPPAAPGCALPTVVVAPFALPWPGFATDLAWQSATHSVWVCSDLGFVSEVNLDGTPGQWGSFSVAPGACGLVPPLTGIAADGAAGGFSPPTLYATDGVTVARFVVNGTPPFPQMHSPFPCFPLSAPSCNGLGATLHPIAFGAGTDGGGGTPPVMRATGQTSQPSGPITLTLSRADPTAGTVCVLIYNLVAPLCPAQTILGGNLLYVTPGPKPVGPLAVVGGTASVSFSVQAAGGLFFGFPMHLQWLVAKGSGGYQVSNALSFTVGFP